MDSYPTSSRRRAGGNSSSAIGPATGGAYGGSGTGSLKSSSTLTVPPLLFHPAVTTAANPDYRRDVFIEEPLSLTLATKLRIHLLSQKLDKLVATEYDLRLKRRKDHRKLVRQQWAERERIDRQWILATTPNCSKQQAPEDEPTLQPALTSNDASLQPQPKQVEGTGVQPSAPGPENAVAMDTDAGQQEALPASPPAEAALTSASSPAPPADPAERLSYLGSALGRIQQLEMLLVMHMVDQSAAKAQAEAQAAAQASAGPPLVSTTPVAPVPTGVVPAVAQPVTQTTPSQGPTTLSELPSPFKASSAPPPVTNRQQPEIVIRTHAVTPPKIKPVPTLFDHASFRSQPPRPQPISRPATTSTQAAAPSQPEPTPKPKPKPPLPLPTGLLFGATAVAPSSTVNRPVSSPPSSSSTTTHRRIPSSSSTASDLSSAPPSAPHSRRTSNEHWSAPSARDRRPSTDSPTLLPPLPAPTSNYPQPPSTRRTGAATHTADVPGTQAPVPAPMGAGAARARPGSARDWRSPPHLAAASPLLGVRVANDTPALAAAPKPTLPRTESSDRGWVPLPTHTVLLGAPIVARSTASTPTSANSSSPASTPVTGSGGAGTGATTRPSERAGRSRDRDDSSGRGRDRSRDPALPDRRRASRDRGREPATQDRNVSDSSSTRRRGGSSPPPLRPVSALSSSSSSSGAPAKARPPAALPPLPNPSTSAFGAAGRRVTYMGDRDSTPLPPLPARRPPAPVRERGDVGEFGSGARGDRERDSDFSGYRRDTGASDRVRNPSGGPPRTDREYSGGPPGGGGDRYRAPPAARVGGDTYRGAGSTDHDRSGPGDWPRDRDRYVGTPDLPQRPFNGPAHASPPHYRGGDSWEPGRDGELRRGGGPAVGGDFLRERDREYRDAPGSAGPPSMGGGRYRPRS